MRGLGRRWPCALSTAEPFVSQRCGRRGTDRSCGPAFLRCGSPQTHVPFRRPRGFLQPHGPRGVADARAHGGGPGLAAMRRQRSALEHPRMPGPSVSHAWTWLPQLPVARRAGPPARAAPIRAEALPISPSPASAAHEAGPWRLKPKNKPALPSGTSGFVLFESHRLFSFLGV